jgi:NitT/TauT family transport system substrate-binding protein
MRVWHRFALMALALILTVSSLACAAPTLRIGTQPWLGYGPWWIAQERGFFAARGVNVHLVNFVQDQDVNAALASKRLEGANIATHTAIKFVDRGVDVRLVLLMDASYEADAIIASSSIKSVKDLRNKRVAFEEVTTSDLLLTYALQKNGMSKSDIRPVPMPAADAGSALIAGRVDVAVTYEPYLTAALKRSDKHSLIYSARSKPGLISDALAFRPDVLEKNPEAVRAMLLAWQDALDFMASNPKEAKAIIARNVESSLEELEPALAGVKFYGLKEAKTAFRGDFGDVVREVGQVMRSNGWISSTPNPDTLLSTTYLP